MLTSAAPMQFDLPLTEPVSGFPQCLRANKDGVAIAALLAFAGPLTFFTGALGVMRAPTAVNITWLGMWWTLYGVALWCMLLIAGYVCDRLSQRVGRHLRGAMWLAAACAAAALANILTAGRESILIEQGLVRSASTMHLHGFIFSLIMALLYFAHLRRSRVHQQAKARLAAAQTAQRHARRRMVQSRLQEVQARMNPRVLFEMLDVMRRLYLDDAARAETFLDELIAFLRAALPRLRTVSSSLLREAELARAFVRLNALAAGSELSMATDVAPDVLHARFPPGVLLPLLDGPAGNAPCRLGASRSNETCRVVLELGTAPSSCSVDCVQFLIAELYGETGNVAIENGPGEINVIVKVPYELA